VHSVAKACAKDSLNCTVSNFGNSLNQALVDAQHLVFDSAVVCVRAAVVAMKQEKCTRRLVQQLLWIN